MAEKKFSEEELKEKRAIAEPYYRALKSNLALALKQHYPDWFCHAGNVVADENKVLRQRIERDTGVPLFTLYPELEELSVALRNRLSANNSQLSLLTEKYQSLGLKKVDAEGQMRDLQNDNYMLDRTHIILDGRSPLKEFRDYANGILGTYHAIMRELEKHINDEGDPDGIWLEEHSFSYNLKIYQLLVDYPRYAGKQLK